MVERNVPLCKQRSRQRPVWLTDEIMRLIRLKRRKWKVFKQQRTAVSEEELWIPIYNFLYQKFIYVSISKLRR
jgi:hypothetical protein